MEKVKENINKKTIRIILLIVLDIIIFTLCSFLAIGLRFDFNNIPAEFMINILRFLWLDIILVIVTFAIFRIYLSMWTYASIDELISIALACVSFIVMELCYKYMLTIHMPRSYYLLQLLLMVFFVSVSRFSYRLFRTLRNHRRDKKGLINTMIIGAGDASKLLITEINNNPTHFKNDIKCIIDDDENKIGRYINSIPIVGNHTKIAKMCESYDIAEIIITLPSNEKSQINTIVEECQKTSAKIHILPQLSGLMDKTSMEQVRPLTYEDFLGRSQIVVDIKEISSSIEDKTILITGGGGSIGSELCRQIAKCKPKKLIIFDIYENNAYDIEQELIRNNAELALETIIGSVRDLDRVEDIFKKYKPDQVFHAAAHKHVPLMEKSPNEAIKNNCLGTLNVVKMSHKYKVNKFVLISSDKAVRPTNIMGATKRICEMIVQSYNRISKTDFVAVRFGNVLGSNGSVIPLFLKQIESGGPVTVTHKEITRYFMTIPEAVSLILQASVYAEGGEIFVLDMGQPVKIYDLAKQIIRFKGLEPDVDIEIKITGLRPGEKLYEELLMDEEGLQDTPNKLIHIGKPIKMDDEKFLTDLEKLIESSYKNRKDIKEKVAKIVDTYKIEKKK